MRIASLLIAICCCLSAVSAQWSGTMTVLPAERPVPSRAAVVPKQPVRSGVPFDVNIGTLDTIGGTTFDWQFNGPAWRVLVNSPGYGIHAAWMYSVDMSSSFPDRNMRYQYYDVPGGFWNWIDPDYMVSGVSVFPMRTGFGSVDIDTSGAAVISAHYATDAGTTPIVARDVAPGAGIFEYAPGEPTLDGFEWPPVAVNTNGYCQLAMLDFESADDLYTGRSTEWPEWEPAVYMGSPMYPCHNIATSKVPGSNKVCITWVVTPDSGYMQEPGYYRESSDGGENWSSPVDIGFPPAFSPGSETVPSFHITSALPFYDNDDRLNIVANVSPYVNDTAYIVPSEIWHFCPDNTPHWNRIHRAGCDPGNLQGSVGYNATYACRPSIGQDDYGDLFAVWEQFDSANVETTTMCLRADVWAAGSTDGGASWSTPLKLTTPGFASCRFPSVCDLPWPGDSLAVLYEEDQCAGFFVQGEGPATNNPIVVQKVPIDSIVERGPYFGRLKEPNGGETLYAGDTFAIRWIVVPQTFDHGVLSLSTDGGSTFPAVIESSIPPDDTMVLWDSIPQVGCSLCRVKFEAKDSLGATVFSDMSCRNFTIDTVFVGVSENPKEPAGEARLLRSSPNPFARTTTARLVLPSGVPIVAGVYDAAGQKVRTLTSGLVSAGAHDLVWDGTDERGRRMPAGVYYLRTTTMSGTATQAVVLLR